MTARLTLRQDFCAAVAALDRALFLSPAGPGYVGILSGPNGPRKRAFTLGNPDGDDQSKYRRTGNDAAFSDGSGGGIISPRSASSTYTLSRPPLSQHTHSSPLLPVETHYHPGSSGISDTIPATNAADLAASGSHRVGRLNAGLSSLSMSTLAMSDMSTDETFAQHLERHHPEMEAAQTPSVKGQKHQPKILSPVPQPGIPLAVQATTAIESAMQNSSPQAKQQQSIDPQTYAHQALRNQQQQLAAQQQAVVAAQAAAAGVQPLHADLPMSQSTTPVPFYTQQEALSGSTYVTPPMSDLPQFASQYLDIDMIESESPQMLPSQHSAAPVSTSINGATTPSLRPTLGELDFNTLRSVKEDDSLLTSPFTGSQASISSFPFTTSGASAASSSRSRATSISRNTSASRSRAPSASSNGHPHFNFVPDAHELENILGSLTTLPSPINEDEDDDPFYEHHQNGSSESGSLGTKKDVLEPELLAAFNDVFYQWIPRVCSDPDSLDRKGERIHQPLMAKKMAKMDEERLFRPFKFRIQPFTNSFQDACRDLGMPEQDVAPKFVRDCAFQRLELCALKVFI